MYNILIKLLLFTFGLGLYSCDENSSNQNSSIIKTETETKKENESVDQFPMTETIRVGFTNIQEFEIDGPSFVIDMKLKNKTGVKLNYFEIRYFIEIKFKDGKYMYSPLRLFELTEPLDSTAFDEMTVLTTNMGKGEFWLPDEEKVFNLIVNGYFGPNFTKRNFMKVTFERTPETVTFWYQCRARGVDGEFKTTSGNNIMECWTGYQTEIGLR